MENLYLLQNDEPERKSGRKVAENSADTSKASGLKAWRKKIQASTLSYRGAAGDGGDYFVRIQFAGKRSYVNLCSSDLNEAAKRARAFFHDVNSAGWGAAVAKLQPGLPEKTVPVDHLTFGDYLKATEAVWNGRQQTFWDYSAKLRTLIALVQGFEAKGNEKWCGPRSIETPWQKKILAVRLSAVSPAAITEAMTAYVKQHGGDAQSDLAAKHTINSLVRNARSLFSRKAVVPLMTIPLPSTLPFDGVKLLHEKWDECRFERGVDVNALIATAVKELSKDHTSIFVVFLLALGAGLRRNEIDKLRWKEVVQVLDQVEVAKNVDFEPKSSASLRKVNLPPDFYSFILAFKGEAALNDYVILPSVARKQTGKSRCYRCHKVFAALCLWLRKHGMKPRDRKNIQMLRKHFGDIICSTYGIYKATAALGHQKVSTTEKFYVAPPHVDAAPLKLKSE